MKKLSITDIKATEILSVEEKKMVVGGQMQAFTCTLGDGSTFSCDTVIDCYNKTPNGQNANCK